MAWCIALLLLVIGSPRALAETADWLDIELGVRWFKYSASGEPGEINHNPVFQRWESINQSPEQFTVTDYAPLEPLYFLMSFGADATFRIKQHLMLKLSYDHANPMGIGGQGHISYSQAGGATIFEEKEFSYTSHQVGLFVGPTVPLADGKAELYLGFAPMAPTWVRYEESYRRTDDDKETDSYDRTWNGFFGSCRAQIGLQVRVWQGLKIGSEATFAFLNYMKLESGDLVDHSFQFPLMKWNFTARYEVF